MLLRNGVKACVLAWLAIGSHACGERVEIALFRNPALLPTFSVTDLDGKTVSSDSWRGKVVFVNFWATWCPPCRAEIPDLVALQKEYRDQIVVIGISEDEGPVEGVRQFAAEHGVNYPIAMVTPEMRKIFKGIAALPTTFVIDREGRLVQKHVGQLNPVRTETEARVLAGLDTNVKVVHVEDADKVRLETAAEAKALPGVDLAVLNDTQRRSALQELLATDCSCGCGLTLAVCRLEDTECPVSLPAARAVVARHAAAR
jgi:thiol-disulfide isomerase/thioredoxin